jgi:hypothetical protein
MEFVCLLFVCLPCCTVPTYVGTVGNSSCLERSTKQIIILKMANLAETFETKNTGLPVLFKDT